MENPNKYPIPLYLNQKYVFDILAMMEGGLSQFETIKTTQTDQEESTKRFAGDIGVKNVFAFLGVSLGAERGHKGQAGESQEITKEKVHTPNSLFAKLRERLYEQKLIAGGEFTHTKTGDFVETKLTLRKNPLIDALDSIVSIMKTAAIFAAAQQNQKGQKADRSSRQMVDQFDSLLRQLNAEGTLDLIGINPAGNDVKFVLTLDRAFLGDPSLSDLVDGEYTVLGKVSKVIQQDSEEKVNLLRKTTLGKIRGRMLEQMKEPFSSSEMASFNIPEIVTEIEGPAIQLIPIAVFA